MRGTILCVFLILFSLFLGEAFAQEGQKRPHIAFMRPLSGIEAVGLAYHKVADIEPDLKNWASKTRKTLKAPAFDKDVIQMSEFNRLQNKYANFDLNQPLYIRTQVDITNYSTIKEKLFLPAITPRIYFPFDVYGRPVSVMVKDVGQFSEIDIPGKEMSAIYERTGKSSMAVVEMAVLPKLADHENTVELAGTNFWPLLTEIAEFVIWSSGKNPEVLWMWRADGYQPKHDEELMRLFKQ